MLGSAVNDGAGTPVYVILVVWDGFTPLTPWLPHHLWEFARLEAEKMIALFYRQGRFGTLLVRTCRWRPDICRALEVIIRANGFRVKVDSPTLDQDHCRLFTLTR